MLETSARLLRLLSLLQMRRDWSGGDLAERLGVSTRTVRRDVDRLRELGYPVDAVQGTAGYRLAAGSTLPPLLLDDEEALAVAVGLRTTTGGTVGGFEDAALRALTKLEQVMPSRLRHRLQVLQRAVVRVEASAPRVEPDTLIAISDACHRHERLRFEYTNFHGRESVKDVEPHSLVNFNRHWYLVAWDTAATDWRSYRVDRLHVLTPNGPRFPPREAPEGDVVTYLSNQLSVWAWPYRATVTLHRSAAELADRIWTGKGVLEAVDDGSCLLHVGADSPWALSWMITSIDTDFTVTEPPELVEQLEILARRCTAAIRT
ncbi:helix-turn-helix transcriptional regulator [Actinomadura harenae]|uniref:YafY family transcriptional regulator n=1 Tax=Actinomadura harenae TaxID=2483351 RepID=A0A3M2MCH4_9ACTN|nr:YafY family protein [Actinomadura harenae]RMI44898.1 YafY family transcriptional regulator [Actinomadura harenae]